MNVIDTPEAKQEVVHSQPVCNLQSERKSTETSSVNDNSHSHHTIDNTKSPGLWADDIEESADAGQ